VIKSINIIVKKPFTTSFIPFVSIPAAYFLTLFNYTLFMLSVNDF